MNNYNLSLAKNQDSTSNFYFSFLQEAQGVLQKFSRRKRLLLNNLAYFEQKYRVASPSQTTLGYHSGIGREHANRSLQEFKELDFITSQFRYKTTCIYKLNPLFYYPPIAHSLKHLLPNLVLNLLLVVGSGSNHCFDQNVTLIKVKLNPSVINIYLASGYPIADSHSTKRVGAPLALQLQNGWSDGFKKIIRGEKRMSETISPGILGIKSLTLTLRGQIEMMAYPDGIIRQADEAIQRVCTKIENPIGYFRSLCKAFCVEQNIIPNWGMISRLLNFHKVAADAPLVEKNVINQVPISSFSAFGNQEPSKNQKGEGVRIGQAWKEPDRRRYGPAKPFKHEYSDLTPEQKKIQERVFTTQSEMRTEFDKEARKNQFVSTCSLDHEKEINYLLSDEGIQGLQNLGKLLGDEMARTYFRRIVEGHKICQKTNHVQL